MVDLYRPLVQHEEDEKCDGHCYIHMVDESGPGYRACFECGHLYRTQRDLRRAYRRETRRLLAEDPPPDLLMHCLCLLWPWWPRMSLIFFCQECAHDF